MSFKLKIDAKGIPAISPEGLPIWIDSDTNQEEAFDINELRSKIVELGRENKKRRETNKTLEQRLKVVEDIEDLPAFVQTAKTAVEKEKKPNDEVLSLRQQWANEKLTYEQKLAQKQDLIQRTLVQSQFGASQFFTGSSPKTLLSPSVAHKLFGDKFKVEEEDGSMRVVALDNRGEPLYSKKNPEALASFDEAMEQYLADPSFKDLVKFNGAPGSGSSGGKSSLSVDGKTSQQVQAYQEAKASGNAHELIKSKIQ